MEKQFCYKYPRPALTTDALLWGLDLSAKTVSVLLIKRKNPPFKDMYALPGGFVDMDETVEHCAARELEEETGLNNIPLLQMHTFSRPDRDPRGRTISVVFFSLIDRQLYNPVAGDDAASLAWHDLLNLPPLAFDHKEIIDFSVRFVCQNLLFDTHTRAIGLFAPFAGVIEAFGKENLFNVIHDYGVE